jgi:hypothetical protein
MVDGDGVEFILTLTVLLTPSRCGGTVYTQGYRCQPVGGIFSALIPA